MTQERGFTLMEVLVALVLLTLFAVVAYRALDAVLNTQRHATASMSRLNELAAAFALMKSDLANSTVPLSSQDRAASGFHTLSEQDGSEQFSFVRLLPDDAQFGRQRIGYRCRLASLSRLVWQDENNPADLPKESTLLSGLRSCTFKYLNADGQWLSGWQPQPNNLVPRAVELNISDADGTPIRRVMGMQ